MQEVQVCERDIVRSCRSANLSPAVESISCPIGVPSMRAYKRNFEWIFLKVDEHVR